ncbi:MAG TPA: ornithine carbamoyltransferase, partial [Alphaproteobacteria bacterium]|nr:ornithine carbamoyltransferase [Alphaproteobacteria bacterium]
MAGVSKQDFLDLHVIAAEALRKIVDEGHRLKAARRGLGQAAPDPDARQQDKLLAMIFEKPSTRTRVSFDAGMRQLGGQTLNLGGGEMQLGRGETIADTARVLSRYVDAIMIRTSGHDKLLELAEYAEVPVINGLTNFSHPCQLIADLMTFEEHRGPIAGRSVAWCGDGNNVATSWIHAAVQFGFELRLACPDEFAPDPAVLRWAADQRGKVHVTADAQAAVEGTHCVVTDTWVSMGDKDAERRHKLLAPYQVNEKLMDLAAVDAVFMHCLPAHRGEEVTVGV